jgi:hypothetical protein
LKVSFIVTDWEGNPVEEAEATIVTEPEKWKKGKHPEGKKMRKRTSLKGR